MTDICKLAQGLPRRRVLHGFAFAAGSAAFLGASLAGPPASADSKMTQRLVQYRATPNGKADCANCNNFQSPSACRLVEGAVAPTGWCLLYAAK
jgi:hypothetical protein